MLQGHKIARSFARLLLIGAVLVMVSATRLIASASDHVDQALALSQAWVAEIDAGKYEESYAYTCEETRARFAQDRWVLVLQTLRNPWGGVLARHQVGHEYRANGVQGLSGECMVVSYTTDFKNLKGARENVVLKWEDGKWRAAGYIAGPPPSDNGNAPAAQGYSTEVQTNEHVKLQPTPQSSK